MNINAFKKALKSGEVSFSYKKKNGTIRIANGTLCEKRAPKKLPVGKIFYYDTDMKEFYSFNESQLIKWVSL